MKHNSGLDNSELQIAFRNDEQAHRLINTKVGCILVITLMPAGSTLDYFVYPDLLKPFFFVRLLCSAIALGILGILYTDMGSRIIKSLGVIVPMLPAVFIAGMIAVTEGFYSPYYAGINLVLLAVGAVLRWTVRESIIAVLGVLVLYVLTGSLAPHLSPTFYPEAEAAYEGGIIFNNFYFVILMDVIVVVGTYYQSQARFREFSLRFELDQNKQKLEDTNDQLVELNRVKDRFFANISHELRTPLTLMIAPLETMLFRFKDSLDTEMREMLEGMQFNSMRLLKLINDLLDLVRLESGRMEAKKDPLELKPFVHTMHQSAKQVAQDKKITLICEAEEGLGVILGDRDKLEKMFLNLIFNALKFTPEDGRVEMQVRRESDELVFTVEDTGLGIPEKSLPHIFDRFWQADGSSKRKFQGVGIGLSLVKEFTEIQNGTVTVESEMNKGTKFTVRLPFLKGDEHQVMPELDKTSDGGAQADQPGMQSQEWISDLYRRAELFPAISGHSSKNGDSVSKPIVVDVDHDPAKHTVLIADDEPQMRKFLGSQLQRDYNVVKVEDGQEAVDKALEIIPDVILLDLMMPNKDGLQACKEISEHSKTRQIPIILLTARADEEAKLSALSAGASDFLSKPFSTTELHVRIQNLLKAHDFRKQLGNKNHELEKTIDQLKDTETQLVHNEKLASLGRMSAGIIHEINNPLNYTSTGLFMLKKLGKKLPEDDAKLFDEMIGDIEDGMSRVKHIVTDLKTFTHPDGSTMHETDVRELIDSSIRLAGNQMNGTVEVIKQLGEGLEIKVNKNSMVQVMLNLIQNSIHAVKKSDEGVDKPTIWITAAAKDDRCVVTFRDNGSGADEETLKKIFDPFFTTKDVGDGMGLGLSICYRIVEQSGGKIRAESKKGEYFEMIMEFPLIQVEASANAA